MKKQPEDLNYPPRSVALQYTGWVDLKPGDIVYVGKEVGRVIEKGPNLIAKIQFYDRIEEYMFTRLAFKPY